MMVSNSKNPHNLKISSIISDSKAYAKKNINMQFSLRENYESYSVAFFNLQIFYKHLFYL